MFKSKLPFYAAMLLLSATSARAEDAAKVEAQPLEAALEASADAVPSAEPVPSPAEAPEAGLFASFEALNESELGELRGGQTIIVGNQTLTAVTRGNILNGDYQAGAVTLSDNALSNFNGVGNLAINTGAQVSLQSGMNLIINVGR
jgi:hypothetical protein